MASHLGCVAVLVRDYDEAIAYYTGTLGFTLLEAPSRPRQTLGTRGATGRP